VGRSSRAIDQPPHPAPVLAVTWIAVAAIRGDVARHGRNYLHAEIPSLSPVIIPQGRHWQPEQHGLVPTALLPPSAGQVPSGILSGALHF